MSDIATVLHGVPRLLAACRAHHVLDTETGEKITSRQAAILRHLDGTDPTMVGELADYVGVTASTMSLTLKRMEAAGFISRARDPSDRRVTNVLLTEAGVRVAERITMLDPERVDRLLGRLDSGERAQAVSGLGLLVKAANDLIAAGRAD